MRTRKHLSLMLGGAALLAFAAVPASAEDSYSSTTHSKSTKVIKDGQVQQQKTMHEHSAVEHEDGLFDDETKRTYQKTSKEMVSITPGLEKQKVLIQSTDNLDLQALDSVMVYQKGQPVQGVTVEMGPLTQQGRIVYLKAKPEVKVVGPVQLMATNASGKVQLPTQVTISKSETISSTTKID